MNTSAPHCPRESKTSTALIYKFTLEPNRLLVYNVPYFAITKFFFLPNGSCTSIVAKKDLTYLSWHLLGCFTNIMPLLCQPVKLESKSYLLISKYFTEHPFMTLFHAFFIRARGFLRMGGVKTLLALLMISESRVWFL